MGKRRRKRERMGGQPEGAIVPTADNLPGSPNPTPPPRASSARGGVVVRQEMVFMGPLPHPDILKQFDEAHHGTARIIVDKFDKQSDHRRDIEARVVRAQIRQADVGQWMAFTLFGAIITGGLFLSYSGRDLAGFGAIVVAVAGGVTALRAAARAKRGDLADKRGEKRK